MPAVTFHWTLVFTASSLEHLAERDIGADDVADAVSGRHGPVRVRLHGRGRQERWFVVAPLDGAELITCVLRAAEPRDLAADGAFVVPALGLPEEPGAFQESMRLCVTGWMSHDDEIKSYRAWRRTKGGR